MSNLSRVLNEFRKNFPPELKDRIDMIEKIVVDYIIKNGYEVKFLNSCNTGFQGVRTKNYVIVCAPSNMETIGDFLYVIFHELRHEQQVGTYKIPNPLKDFDFEDFETLYEHYWELELDADQFAKNMVAKIIIKLKIPIEFAKQQFKLSNYIERYPMASETTKNQLRFLIDGIKQMKRNGMEYEDIIDHPFVKKHIDRLENFI